MNSRSEAVTLKGSQLRRKRGLNLDLNQPLPFPIPDHGFGSSTSPVLVIDLEAIDDGGSAFGPDSDCVEVSRIKTQRNSGRTTPGAAAPAKRTLLQPKKDQTATAAASCPICMGPLVEETSTRCGHIFCKACIRSAMAVKAVCPTCRKRLNKRGLIRVFLPAITHHQNTVT